MKGESSGHTQTVRDIAFDCDGDTLLIPSDADWGGRAHEGTGPAIFRSVGVDGSAERTTEPQLETPSRSTGKK